jgi:thiol:disulfide interchange protein
MNINEHKAKTNIKQLISKPLVKWTAVALFGCVLYLGNTYVQSQLGRQTLADTGLTISTLDEALVKAKKGDKLVLANMTAIWCPSCRKLDREVFSNEQVKAAMAKDFVFARIEYDAKEGEDFMAKYQVYGFPTLVILNSEGDKLHHLPLTFDPETFASLLSKAIALQ